MRIVLAPRTWLATGVAFMVAIGTRVPAGWSPPGSVSARAQLSAQPVVSAAPQEVLADDPVDGEPVAGELAGRRPLAVIIENLPPARPQWGLSLASRVYEAITEGGITRYLVIFGANDADRIGPIRSARTQFLDYVLELDAALAHVGGNQDALDLIGTLHIKDLDEFRNDAPYRRIFKPHLAFEHTMFASTRALRGAIEQKGWGERVALDRPAWKDDTPAASRPANQTVTIEFSSPEYRVAWVYRPDLDDYQRFLAGAPDFDAATGAPVIAKSIAIAVVPRVQGRTRIREDTWTFSDIGSGRAWVLQDGRLTEGQWRKPSRTERLRFVDATGQEIAFDRGPQWIEIIPPEVQPSSEPPTATQ